MAKKPQAKSWEGWGDAALEEPVSSKIEASSPRAYQQKAKLPATYTHTRCGASTHAQEGVMLALVHNPDSYRGLFCAKCRRNFPVEQFSW